MRKRVASILFWFVAALSAAMLATLLAVVGGVIPVDPPRESATPTTAAAPLPASTGESTTVPTETKTTPKDTPPTTAATATTAAPPPAPTLVVVTASRGDSWFSARVASESGRVLDERVLPRGESVRLQAERIWLTVGAAGNVDVTVNGKARTIAPGTIELVLTRATSSAN